MMRQVCLILTLVAVAGGEVVAGDWPNWRGPEQTGMSRENAVVTSWSEGGENLLWKVPVGGRTTPIVMGDRVYAITPVGSGECLQERVICLDADTGKTIWEHRFNVYHTDIVEVRLGWTAVVGDPETGNVYAHGTGGELFCFSRDGEVLWKRSLGEELGRYSGYGGRLHFPIIDEDRLIVSYIYILSNWQTGKKKAGHRYVAFDKKTGRIEWWSQPGGRPLDTTYSTPVVTVINGKRMLIGGNADGGVYGMYARTGERVWSFKLAKRGINTSVVVDGNYVYVTHSEENLDGTEMGRIVCIDASKTGDLTGTGEVWRVDGFTAGYSSPVIANGRLYATTNSATLNCFDARTGKKYWEYGLGRVMKGSPVVTADGVIYVGEVNGRFHILKDAGDECRLLDRKEFGRRGDAVIEIQGSPVVANGRVYFMTSFDMYCLGAKTASQRSTAIPPMDAEAAPQPTKPAVMQIVPMDAVVAPGERLALEVRLFDENSRLLAAPTASWTVDGPKGTIDASGIFVAGAENTWSGGVIRATAGGMTAEARIRVTPKLPINETFDGMAPGPFALAKLGWIGMDLRTELVEKDGSIVLHKLAKSPSAPYSRMRSFSGPPIPAGYTVSADLLASPRKGRRPTLSDMGLINSRYKLILLGYEKRLRLVSYSPIPRVQTEAPFDWQPDTWYRAKLTVDISGGKATVRGKAWPRDGQEPEGWMIEMVDPCPNVEGSPGLYAYSKGTRPGKPGSSVYFDNYQVERND